jgi:hypothetical protein
VQRWPNIGLDWHDGEVAGRSGRRWRGRFEARDLLPTRKPLRFVLESVDR